MLVSTSFSAGGISKNIPLVKALNRCFASRETVTLVVIGSEMSEQELLGIIVDVDLDNQSYFLDCKDDDEPKKFTFRFTHRLIDTSGCVIVNPQADEYRENILQTRQDKQTEIHRMQGDDSAISFQDHPSFKVLDSVDGTINSPQRRFYLVGGKHSTSERAVLYAKNEHQLRRALSVLNWDMGFWEAFPILLQSHFLWVGWERLREAGRKRAAEIRGSSPLLQKSALSVRFDYHLELDRMAMYKAAGLSHQEYGPGAALPWFEGQAVDYEAVFAWADRVPTAVLRDYLINVFASNEIFRSKDVSQSKLQLEETHELVIRRANCPLREHMEYLPIKRVREMIQACGSTLKANSKAPLIDFLLGHMTPTLESQIRTESRIPNCQNMPPPGLSWDDFQFLREDYKWMYGSLNFWLFNGSAAPKAAEVFSALG